MKVVLLQPAFGERGVVKLHGFKILPYGLLQLASVTPPDVELAILDEKVAPFPERMEADLIGISIFTTATAARGYQLAQRYRAQGIPVVVGGAHASALPDEALRFADSVAVGEAETIWPTILRDAQRGVLQRRYTSALPDLATLPTRRPWHLLETSRYPAPLVVQTTRGCPVGCDFCSVPAFSGRRMRHKSIDQVFADIEDVATVPASLYTRLARTLFFLDDSFGTDVLYYKTLMQAIVDRDLKFRWVTQATTAIAQKPDLLRLAEKSGCVGVLIGFESLSQESLREADKSYRAAAYAEIIDKLHDHGIGVEGTFIFGFDSDDEGVFERTVEFAERTRLNVAQFSSLTPLPGTPMFERYRADGRLLYEPWEEPSHWARFYSLPSLARRFGHHLWRQSPRDTLVTWTLNWGFRHLGERPAAT
jgi:radical SAM superfamily enzyme YgiQ (UPF0313 family)